MARIARVVVPGLPHHVTQRGNRRQRTFFCYEDYQTYISLMAEWCLVWEVEIWAYCLMPNHVHLISVPSSRESLRRAIGEAHRRYTRYINFREGWRGYLWQGRFGSFPMDKHYLLSAARYIELNPVRAGMVTTPEAYRWSSASAHLSGKDDTLVKVTPMLGIVEDWVEFLSKSLTDEEIKKVRRHTRTGRPLGNEGFVEELEWKLGRALQRKKPGPKPGGKIA